MSVQNAAKMYVFSVQMLILVFSMGNGFGCVGWQESTVDSARFWVSSNLV